MEASEREGAAPSVINLTVIRPALIDSATRNLNCCRNYDLPSCMLERPLERGLFGSSHHDGRATKGRDYSDQLGDYVPASFFEHGCHSTRASQPRAPAGRCSRRDDGLLACRLAARHAEVLAARLAERRAERRVLAFVARRFSPALRSTYARGAHRQVSRGGSQMATSESGPRHTWQLATDARAATSRGARLLWPSAWPERYTVDEQPCGFGRGPG